MSSVPHPAVVRPYPQPCPHPPESMVGIPFYDEEFGLPQSDAHFATVLSLGNMLRRVAGLAGLREVGDYPTWYWLPDQGRQQALHPDLALSRNHAIEALTATDLVLVVEIVTTKDARKERKDTIRMRQLNEYHGVPEFLMVYPEPEDERSLRWCRHDPGSGQYRELDWPADRRYRSEAVPGLEIEVLPRAEWTLGHKLRCHYCGEVLREAEEEAAERRQATTAKKLAEWQTQQERLSRQATEQQLQRERLARQAAERNAALAEQARLAAEAENARLLARLREAGLMS